MKRVVRVRMHLRQGRPVRAHWKMTKEDKRLLEESFKSFQRDDEALLAARERFNDADQEYDDITEEIYDPYTERYRKVEDLSDEELERIMRSRFR